MTDNLGVILVDTTTGEVVARGRTISEAYGKLKIESRTEIVIPPGDYPGCKKNMEDK